MEFKKERNFIVAYDNEIMQGKWDISTGEFYGKKGTIVKSVPAVFTYNRLHGFDANHILEGAILYYRQLLYLGYTTTKAQRFEALLSVGLYPQKSSDLDDKTKLSKELVEYFKTYHNSCYSTYYAKVYKTQKENAWLEGLNCIYKEVFLNVVNDYNKEIALFAKKCIPVMNREYVHMLFNRTYDIARMINDYYLWSMKMYNEVKLENNFLKNYCAVKNLYQTWEDNNYNELLVKNNDKDFLYFENDTFCAFPLLTRNDFHQEATAQNNCVERLYMDRVKDNETYIVVVRRKDRKDTSYITCEVNHRRDIVQYLERFNSLPQNNEAIKFKSEYAQHLKESINK